MNAEKTTRKITSRYGLALGVLAVAATLGMATMVMAIRVNDSVASVVNVAGRQRMLSQQIALRAVEMAQEPQTADVEGFRNAVDEMRKAHQALAYGAPHPHLNRKAPKTQLSNSAYFDGPSSVSPLINEFFSTSDRIAEKAERSGLTPDDPGVERITELSRGELLTALEEAVEAYDAYGALIMRRFQQFEIAFWLATLLVLALEVRFIFVPGVQRLKKSLKLQDAHRKAALESEERIRSAYDAAPFGLGVLDADGNWLLVNQALTALVGRGRGDLLASPFSALLHPDDVQTGQDVLDRIHASREGLKGEELLLLHRSGAPAPVRFTATNVYKVDGSLRFTVCEFADIAEERLIAEKDRRKNEWLELTQSIGHIGHWFVDLRENQIYWSDEVYHIHGVKLGTKPPSLQEVLQSYLPENRADVERIIHNAIREGKSFSFEQPIIRGDGELRWIFLKSECRINKYGEVVALFGVTQDVTEQRAKDREIRAMKELYEAAMESANIGLWNYSLHKKELYWSPLIYEILGLKDDPEAIAAHPIGDRVHPDDAEHLQSAMRLCIRKGEPFSADFRMRHEDGRYVTLKGRGDLVRGEHGEPASVSGSFADITDEQEVDELRKSIWSVLTRHGVETGVKIDNVLAKTADYFGVRYGLIKKIDGDACYVEHAFSPDGKVKPGDRVSLEQTCCAKVVAEHGPLAFANATERERRGICKAQSFQSGTYIAAPLIVEDRAYGTVSFSSDKERSRPFSHTEFQFIQLVAQWLGNEIARREAQKRLKTSEERFALAVTGASVGIWDWMDVNSDYLWWSPVFYDLIGYTPDEVPSDLDNFRDILHPDDRDRTFEMLNNHIEGKGQYKLEYRLKQRDGGYKWFMASGQAVWDENGEPRRMIGSIMDIDDRVRAESLKSEFVSTVSHELRTPMTSIMGSIGLIQSGNFGEISDKAAGLLKIAANNGQRLVRLINDILDIEKIEAGKISFEYKPVKLSQLLRDAVDQNQAFAKAHGAGLKLIDDCEGVTIKADPDRMIQVLTNLISNAAKFSGDEGIVTVESRLDDEDVVISVIDNGPGIPQDKLNAIFERFFQIDSADTRSKEGTGLGLAIAKAIVDAHSGDLTVDSAIGVGTIFTIRLAQAALEKTNGGIKLEPHSIMLGRSRILHVEDDEDTAALLRHVVSDFADVVTAATAQDACACLDKGSFDLVVLDKFLPDRIGSCVIDHIVDNGAQTPVVMYSVEDLSEEEMPDFVVARYIKSRMSHDVLREKIRGFVGCVQERGVRYG